MQENRSRRSNDQRSEATRASLLKAARKLFVEKSYAETATPEIVAEAGVTRGALYHHFVDKRALLAAVVERESQSVAGEIERAAPESLSPRDALVTGGEAFLDAMNSPGRTRLLLLDGPSVLGRSIMDDIETRHANRTLKDGLATAIEAGVLPPLPLEALTAQLAAMYDRAALAIEAGGSADDHRAVLKAIIDGLVSRSC
ncbi:TetR/AcrR family transcriptional regulator [Mesorhizobium sp. CAU 1741]|uniref:TetR/AcrR family transcriptional regulator n=1 Tax=Mesorhizobium sp. CAU 1741 TaxID=3140366 RepID=UPI00325C1347